MSGESQRLSVDDLPDEILCNVFLSNTVGEGQTVRETLISTCLVCKRWHTLLASYPLIWSRVIDFEKDSPECVAELLHRSGATPFEVGGTSVFEAVRQQNRHSIRTLQSIFEHNSRVKTMNLNIRYAPWELICKDFLSYPAPNLEFLNLITSCPFPNCSHDGPLFANQAPRLTRFHMQRCLTDFSSPTLHNLTDLSVFDIVAPEQPAFMPQANSHTKLAPTVLGWLQILQNMPSLRYLTLVNSVTRTAVNDEVFIRTILPNLHLLSLCSFFDEGSTILDRLDIPASCGIRLKCTARHSASPSSGSKLLAALSHQLTHWPKGSARRYLQAKLLDGDRVHFGNSRRIGLIWNVTDKEELANHARSSPDPLVWLVLDFNDDMLARRFLGQLLAIYETTHSTITCLDFWIDEVSTSTTGDIASLGTLVNYISWFTNLEMLNLIGQSPVHILPLFKALSTPDHIIFPHLRSVHLTGTIFEPSSNQVSLAVIGFLVQRVELQAPLAELWIVDGEIPQPTRLNLEVMGGVKVMIKKKGIGI